MPVLGMEEFECIGPTDNQRSIIMLKENAQFRKISSKFHKYGLHISGQYSIKFHLNITKQFYEQQNPNAPEGKTKKRKVKNSNSENKRQKI